MLFLCQALQSKHDALLKRVDELDTECEQLRDRVLEAEGERDELQGAVDDLETEKDRLAEELDSKQVRHFVEVVKFLTAMKKILSIRCSNIGFLSQATTETTV